jgi:hypothetical protein
MSTLKDAHLEEGRVLAREHAEELDAEIDEEDAATYLDPLDALRDLVENMEMPRSRKATAPWLRALTLVNAAKHTGEA